ncbi:MAG: S41 family peptidase [Chitinophagales bacterium]
MNYQQQGYYSQATIYKNKIVFVSENDLWQVDRKGGVARRLTANLGEVSNPCFSPDGKYIAFSGREEGTTEVYVMSAEGGLMKRLTFFGSFAKVLGWKDDKIIFTSNYGQAFFRFFQVYEIATTGGEAKKLPLGMANAVSFGDNMTVLGRNTREPAHWKRYRGGRTGKLWIDANNSGEYKKLLNLDGNFICPMIIKDRVYFISDHEGIGNIYSCLADATDLQQHTFHKKFYVRNASTNGKHIVYQAAGDIYCYNLKNAETEKVNIKYYSTQTHEARKFVKAADFLESYQISPKGKTLAIIARGKSFVMKNWNGAVMQFGERQGVRYKCSAWLNDSERMIVVSSENGEDRLEIYQTKKNEMCCRLKQLDLGRITSFKVSPVKDEILLTNNRNELICVDLEQETAKTIVNSKTFLIAGYNWSPDGNWITYASTEDDRVTTIKIYSCKTEETHQVTDAVLNDVQPTFDASGKYLFFLSSRTFNPVYDNFQFGLNFPKGMKPYLLTLRKDIGSPFLENGKGFGDSGYKRKKDGKTKEKIEAFSIDFENIQNRIVPFPVAEGNYSRIVATQNRVFYTFYHREGALTGGRQVNKVDLKAFDLNILEEGTIAKNISDFEVSANGKALIYKTDKQVRVVKATLDVDESLPRGKQKNRKDGWIDLNRIKVAIEPKAEWQQIFTEAWSLLRDYFWTADMSGIDWQQVRELYEPLVERVHSREELSDLMWEMNGELGTSHAYVMGGDFRPKPNYPIGLLGATLTFDDEKQAYRFQHIAKGDVWTSKNPSPLKRLGLNIAKNMLLLAIDGQILTKNIMPNQLLINRANQEVVLSIADADGENVRDVTVKTIKDTTALYYRDWVENNRKYVREKTNGKVGYIHIPDMSAAGYAEFHRSFLSELDYDGLIIDVRFNRGGHVSQLLLEKLARKRIAYGRSRWMGSYPYPREAPTGNMVAITNEHAGSDGDIFSHNFKQMGLGKLVGTRTWGGVVGIWPRNKLVDGTVTTQPEFGFWMNDVKWKVENYGTDPDIEIDIAPQDYVQAKDPQLDRGIEEILKDLESKPFVLPAFDEKPNLTPPWQS